MAASHNPGCLALNLLTYCNPARREGGCHPLPNPAGVAASNNPDNSLPFRTRNPPTRRRLPAGDSFIASFAFTLLSRIFGDYLESGIIRITETAAGAGTWRAYRNVNRTNHCTFKDSCGLLWFNVIIVITREVIGCRKKTRQTKRNPTIPAKKDKNNCCPTKGPF